MNGDANSRLSATFPIVANTRPDNRAFIDIRRLVKAYKTPAGDFVALNSLDLQIQQGEFVAVIGKSGSGKTTLINMLTGIDRPSSGEIYIGDAALHSYDEEQMAAWRGRHLGIVFQFFQLMPTLTLVENVMLPMDINHLYPPKERRERALQLLELVEMADQARKMPTAVSGGQQQRVAIARALANDPSLLVADEPTGNLDSRTADRIFQLFERLAAAGKTVIMVTHDESLAARVQRTVLIADGEVVNEHFARALSALGHDQLVEIRRQVEPIGYAAGNVIIRQGEAGDRFYIITEGRADVTVEMPDGREVLVDRLRAGQYFGEMALVQPGPRRATVRAAADSPVSVLALDSTTFNDLIEESPRLRTELQRIIDVRAVQSQMQALAHLPQDELESLARQLPVKSIPPGEVILKQGSLGQTFYLISSGDVEVYAEMGDGRTRQIDHRGPGDYFGEMALLGDGRRRATVRAAPTAPVRLVEIGIQDFDRLRHLSPTFAAALTASAAEHEARLTL